ncbi:MAG: hypothetical protein MI923_08050 [Phycisphaerales bacterium]|nr:hypothetical protein [Phycisphaerales bacterium]
MINSIFLAQSPYHDRIRGLRSAFDNKQTDPTDVKLILVYIVILLAVIVSLLLVKKFRLHKEGSLAPQQPFKLFNRVLKQMEISLVDRILLRMLARSTHMLQPTVMLFSPELFEQHAGRWADSITFKFAQSHARRRLNAVAEKAFGAPDYSAG